MFELRNLQNSHLSNGLVNILVVCYRSFQIREISKKDSNEKFKIKKYEIYDDN